MKKILFALLLLCVHVAFAQPANDNPCGAVNIPVIENADGCSPQNYTITNATYLNLAVPNACGTSNPDVWYSFTSTRNYIYISVSGPVQIQLYTAPSCNGTFIQDGSVNCFNGSEISFGISAGTLYYMRISNNANNGNFTFTTCVTTKYPSKTQRVGINTKTPQYNFDVKGRAYFTDSTEFLRSVKFYSGIEVSNALKLSLPSAGTNKILTSDVDGNASWQSLQIPAQQWILNNNTIYNSNAGNVGIGTNSPLAKLHVADSSVVFTGPTYLTSPNEFAPPVQGGGSRMMWFPQKAAFRVGLVIDNQWDKPNIGAYSFATGLNTKAKGDYTQSLGFGTSAIGPAAFSSGYNTTATGGYASSLGYYTEASGFAAVSMGSNTNAKATNSTAMGAGTIAGSFNSLVIGTYNDTSNTNRYFEVGIGLDNNRRNNAFTILNNGNVGIGTTTPSGPLAFKNEVGNKIILYGNAAAQYGIGIQGGLLQLYADVANSDIALGYGSSSAFTERMRIKGNGNVGIGTSTPSSPLSFPPVGGKKISLFPGATGDVSLGVYANELRITSDNANAKVSFGFDNYVNGYTELALAQRNGTFAFSVLGNLWVNGTTYASDERFKQNITPISSPLQKLLQINGVEYEMNTQQFPNNHFQRGRQIGLLAQNVEKIVPEAVNEKDGYKGVDYARLVPLLIESIKELKKEIELLKTQVNH